MELQETGEEAPGEAEVGRVNIAAARQEMADLAGAQPHIILPAAIRDSAQWASRATDFMREVEAAALAAAPTQPSVGAVPAQDAAMAAPDDDVAAFAEAQEIDLASLPDATRDFARAGIAEHLRPARLRASYRPARSRSRSRGV